MNEGWLNRQLSNTAETTKELPAWKQELRTLDKRPIVERSIDTQSVSTNSETEPKPAQSEKA
jgi:hypothetical protein